MNFSKLNSVAHFHAVNYNITIPHGVDRWEKHHTCTAIRDLLTGRRHIGKWWCSSVVGPQHKFKVTNTIQYITRHYIWGWQTYRQTWQTYRHIRSGCAIVNQHPHTHTLHQYLFCKRQNSSAKTILTYLYYFKSQIVSLEHLTKRGNTIQRW